MAGYRWKQTYMKKLLKKELKKKKPNPVLIELYNGDKSYDDYLKMPHWLEIKKRKLKQADYKCEICGEDEIALQVHHKHYRNIGNEKDEDLAVLCPNCHKDVHSEIAKLKGKEFRQKLMKIAVEYF